MLMGTTSRDPQSAGGKLATGINPLVVMVGAVLLFGFIVLALCAVIFQGVEDSEQTDTQSTLASGAPAETPIPQRESSEAEQLNSPQTTPSTPTSVQGYLVFGARSVPIRSAEAQLSRDRTRIAVLLYSDERRGSPTVSMVLELTPNSTRCDEASLLKSSLIIHLPFGPNGGAFSTRITRTRSSKAGFPDVERFECIRTGAGKLQLTLLGDDAETSQATGWALRYGVALTIPLEQTR